MAWNESQLVDALIVALVQNSPFESLAGAPMPSELEDQMEEAMERIADPIYNFVESWAIEPGTLELSYQFKTDLNDPLPGYLEDKIDNLTLQIDEDNRKLYVASTNIATNEITGGIRIGTQPFLYMSGANLLLNAEASPLLIGGDNTVPTSRAVKIYVDTAIQGLGGSGGIGDMLKSTYDTNNNGVVDDSEMLDTQLPAYYLNWNNFTNTPTTIAGYGITDVYTETEIDAFFEGESSGKKQIDWLRVINRDSVVSVSGIGIDNQIAIFQSGNVIEGDPNFMWDGDSLILAQGKGLKWGDGDTGFWESSPNILYLQVANSSKLYVDDSKFSFFQSLIPASNKISDIGSSTYFWRYGYFDRLYIDSTSKYLDVSSSDLTLTDSVAGTKTLSELASNSLSILYKRGIIPSGQTNYFYIGTTTENTGLHVRYYLRIAGNYESGIIYVINKAGSVTMDRSSFGDNLGVLMSVGVEGSNIRLEVTSPGSDVYFGYTIIYGDRYDGPNYWEGINKPLNSVTLTPSSTTEFCVGTQNHISIKIQYGIVRGNLSQVGELIILAKSGITEVEQGSVGGNVGCTLGARYENVDALDYVYLTATLDGGETATMFYDVIYDDYDRTWDDVRGFKKFEWVSNNHTNRYQIGNKYDYIGLEIYYEIRRGTQYQTGKIFISDNGTSSPYKDFTSFGDSCGIISYDAEVDSYGNYKMVFVTDNSGVTGELEYKVLPIKRPFNWDNIISQIGGKFINNIIKSPTVTQDGYVISWDNSAEEYTLTAVESGGDYWQRISTVISPVTGGDSVDIGTGELLVGNRILFSEIPTPSVPAVNTGYLYMDSSDEKLYFKTSTQTYDLTQSAATSYWQRVGTDLKPVTSGDDILLAQGTESISWGDGDTYIFEPGSNTLRVVTGGSVRMDWDDTGIIRFYGSLLPYTSGVFDMGNVSLRFRYQHISGYIDFSEISTPGTPAVNTGYLYMDSSDEKLYFKTNSTIYDLTAAAGSSPWTLDGTNIKPTTGGNDILLSSGEILQFGTTSTEWIITFPNAQSLNTGIRWDHDDTSLSFLDNNVEHIRMELDSGIVKVSGTSGLFQGVIAQINTLQSNLQNDLLIKSVNGDVLHSDGYDITIRTGNGYGTGDNDGGNLFIQGGDPNGIGSRGGIFIGTGSTGHLPEDTGANYMVTYNPSTGKLSYKAI